MDYTLASYGVTILVLVMYRFQFRGLTIGFMASQTFQNYIDSIEGQKLFAYIQKHHLRVRGVS